MMHLQVFPSVLCVQYFSISPAAVALRRTVDLRKLLAVVRSLAPAPVKKMDKKEEKQEDKKPKIPKIILNKSLSLSHPSLQDSWHGVQSLSGSVKLYT